MKIQLLNEELYGNMATVYHRCKKLEPTLKSIFDNNYKGGAEMFGHGIYCVFDDHDKNGSAINSNSMYGKYLIKAVVKGIYDYFFFDYDAYKKVFKNRASPRNTYLADQAKKFGLDPDVVKKLGRDTFAKENGEGYRFFKHTAVAGVVLQDKYDGSEIVPYNHKSVIPVAWTDSEVKGNINSKDIVWHKIDRNNSYTKRALNNDNIRYEADRGNPKNSIKRERNEARERNIFGWKIIPMNVDEVIKYFNKNKINYNNEFGSFVNHSSSLDPNSPMKTYYYPTSDNGKYSGNDKHSMQYNGFDVGTSTYHMVYYGWLFAKDDIKYYVLFSNDMRVYKISNKVEKSSLKELKENVPGKVLMTVRSPLTGKNFGSTVEEVSKFSKKDSTMRSAIKRRMAGEKDYQENIRKERHLK